MGTGMGSPSQAPVRLTFVPHGLPPANAPQSMPNPPPMPPQLYQVPPPTFSIRMHNYVRADEQAEIAHSVADAQALDLGPASPLSQATLFLR
ncbi:hypothetical protein PtrSN002B_010347 [Pyrenophora tritici-repentis]|nr:hypothetical protein PtrV1_06472 [Pyrenophora tritici-repentis]KAI0616850.1 hypothetical protein TUN199_11157 [Pyrenophora tritici-repentis]KAI1533454.1 hypothetical protein PtrSN002B_010347 [Pyrenophora tritici-repentis]PZD27986.1 hypothetical protein A1F96_06266 [Pyrenophora tritici-repentis]